MSRTPTRISEVHQFLTVFPQKPPIKGTFKMNSSQYKISIEEGILAGKSTILKDLDDLLEEFYPGEAQLIPEPLNLWTNYRGYV